MSQQVLVVSHDAMLLQTRQLILGAFFQAEGAGRVREVEALMSRRTYDLVILCYTLTDLERSVLMEVVAQQKHPPRVLLLTPVGSPALEPGPGGAMMSEAGPYYLLKKAAEMLGVDIRAKACLVEA